MVKTSEFSPLKLVNQTLENARAAGQTVDQHYIDFVWKIARSKVSDEEISAWVKARRPGVGLLDRGVNGDVPCLDPTLLAVAENIWSTLDKIRSRLIEYRQNTV